MSAQALSFSPGSLVRARGREWIVLPGQDAPLLRLRPLSGSEADVQLVDPALEQDGVAPAHFEPPHPERVGTQADALLLKDAASSRCGGAPVRSAAPGGSASSPGPISSCP